MSVLFVGNKKSANHGHSCTTLVFARVLRFMACVCLIEAMVAFHEMIVCTRSDSRLLHYSTTLPIAGKEMACMCCRHAS
jgi:hypothetical protein